MLEIRSSTLLFRSKSESAAEGLFAARGLRLGTFLPDPRSFEREPRSLWPGVGTRPPMWPLGGLGRLRRGVSGGAGECDLGRTQIDDLMFLHAAASRAAPDGLAMNTESADDTPSSLDDEHVGERDFSRSEQQVRPNFIRDASATSTFPSLQIRFRIRRGVRKECRLWTFALIESARRMQTIEVRFLLMTKLGEDGHRKTAGCPLLRKRPDISVSAI